ncbi:hypothetical protein WKI71_37470 [Streptomyces sp. MS1.AVA.1]|uniref:Uncharacterized protein n=1 Tax=Streptomyces machairae TaxID=3134109 RepID=A0ABU8UTQ0_9ACTN
MPVRLFDSVVSTLGGGPGLTEAMGLEAADVVVVETDGTYEQADSLKTAYDGAPVTGKDVHRHTLDEVAGHPGIAARQHGLDDLSDQCRACPVVRSCGGGLFAHRYRSDGTGFGNPSVFCADLKELILSIDARTGASATRPIESLDALADGSDEGAGVRELARVRQDVTRGLLTAVHEEVGPRAGELWARSWQLALDLGRRDGALLEPLLSHPYTRTWAVRCLDDAASPDELASLVAAVALPARAVEQVKVPVHDGFAHLPGLGSVRTRLGAQRIELTRQRLAGPDWEPLPRVRADGLDVALDDVDPHRDCYATLVGGRLTDAETELWRHVLPQAWALIRKAVPGRRRRHGRGPPRDHSARRPAGSRTLRARRRVQRAGRPSRPGPGACRRGPGTWIPARSARRAARRVRPVRRVRRPHRRAARRHLRARRDRRPAPGRRGGPPYARPVGGAHGRPVADRARPAVRRRHRAVPVNARRRRWRADR